VARDGVDAWHVPRAPADLAPEANGRHPAALRQELKIGGPALLKGEDRRHVVAQAEDLLPVEVDVACRSPQRCDGGARLEGVNTARATPRATAALHPAASIQQSLCQRLGGHPDLQLDPAPLGHGVPQPGRRLDGQRVGHVEEAGGTPFVLLVVGRDLGLGGDEPLPLAPSGGRQYLPGLQSGLADGVAS